MVKSAKWGEFPSEIVDFEDSNPFTIPGALINGYLLLVAIFPDSGSEVDAKREKYLWYLWAVGCGRP